MKLKLAEIRALEPSLIKLTQKELPVRTAYRLGKILKTISEELVVIEKSRVELVKKYSKGEKEGGNFEVTKEKIDDFKKEFEDFLMEEIDIKFEKVSLSELGNISLTPIDLVRLDKLIYDAEEKIKE